MASDQPNNPSSNELPDAFVQAISSVQKWVDSYLDGIGKRDQDIGPLYHYTTAGGLKGIVESDEIWFTNIRHLNDPSEFQFGLSIAHEELRKIVEKSDERLGYFFTIIPEGLRRARAKSDTFIVSFSRKRNDLSQWRAYADNGRGFSVGLGRDVFAATDEPADQLPVVERHFLAPVDYDLEIIRSKQRRAIEQVFNALDSVKDEITQENFQPLFIELSIQLCVVLIWNSLTAKHEAYCGEQEVRWLLHVEKNLIDPFVKTRVRGSELVSYVPVPFSPSLRAPRAITEVLAGPASSESACDSVRDLFCEVSMDTSKYDLCVERSAIPYRAIV